MDLRDRSWGREQGNGQQECFSCCDPQRQGRGPRTVGHLECRDRLRDTGTFGSREKRVAQPTDEDHPAGDEQGGKERGDVIQEMEKNA